MMEHKVALAENTRKTRIRQIDSATFYKVWPGNGSGLSFDALEPTGG